MKISSHVEEKVLINSCIVEKVNCELNSYYILESPHKRQPSGQKSLESQTHMKMEQHE